MGKITQNNVYTVFVMLLLFLCLMLNKYLFCFITCEEPEVKPS